MTKKEIVDFAKKHYRAMNFVVPVRVEEKIIRMKFSVFELSKRRIEPMDFTMGLRGFYSDEKKKKWLVKQFNKQLLTPFLPKIKTK